MSDRFNKSFPFLIDSPISKNLLKCWYFVSPWDPIPCIDMFLQRAVSNFATLFWVQIYLNNFIYI